MSEIAVALNLSASRVSRVAKRLTGEAIDKACPFPLAAFSGLFLRPETWVGSSGVPYFHTVPSLANLALAR